MLDRAFEADRTGQHRNGYEAAFPVDWTRHALSRHPLALRQMPDHPPQWNAGAANKQTGASDRSIVLREGVK